MVLVGLALALSSPRLVPISPSDRRIVYVGRFDRREASGFACEWPASEVRLRIRGKTLVAKLDETGQDRWQVVVDGKPVEVLSPTKGEGEYTVDAGADGEHEVRLVKRTETFVGMTRFESFDVPGGSLEQAKRARRRIEIVGDSISCGYGNEGANQNERFKPETEDAYMSYGSIAAREVGADVDIIAWSGRKMWPDNTVPEIYDLNLPTDKDSLFDFKDQPPAAIVINLATNDFGRSNPDEAQWTGAYEAFVRRLWTHYPKARIYAAMGSMMSDDYPPKNSALSTLRTYLEHMVARIHDSRLSILEFDPQKMGDGIGWDWHPSVKTHEKMAARLAQRLRTDLHW